MAKKAKAKTAQKVKNAEAIATQSQKNLKKLFLAGLGLADETNEKLHEIFNSLVSKGQIRQPKVKKAVDDIRKRVLERRRELEKRFRSFFGQKELLRSREIHAMLNKVEALEKEVDARMQKEPKKSKSSALSSRKSARKSIKTPRALV